ncbi:CBS domain-containing protein [Natronolimnohabitans sp. A-GB9]|uniref:CBS domain-containing protein n=1 Tax=Natronolimnohabitans sp. A-GB9 TaxID=3069757 RepID=UPI0027B86377|nr:CBS domain-containing protein [Natronolimnohabitans sp. A-GB9]MDQ2051253.1 CBS domain-containing protein [Natronolimnohabitans sp. A-GB9]
MLEIPIEHVLTSASRTLRPETPISEAAQQLRDPEVSALVVLEDKSVVGIVTESDVVAYVAETVAPHPVATIMSSPVATIGPDESIATAARRMGDEGVKQLPVVDGETYRGLVSAEALAPYLSRRRLEIDWQDDPMRIDADDGGVVSTGD